MVEPLLIARSSAGAECRLLPGFANRHGLIAGATGTGKTITLQVLAERFSRIGVPCVLADVKGDLAGLAAPGTASPKLTARLTELQMAAPAFASCPVTFWDVFGKTGHPVRATISDMGPLLLGRLLGLNDTQRGVLTLLFKIADDAGMLLLDLKDLRAMLQFAGDHAKDFTTQYGNISTASVGAIQRALMTIDTQGGDRFFGEPMLDIGDLLRTTPDGRGVVNILSADQLINAPSLYATFLLWLLSELFEHLPEIGDPEKPTVVFFFDEAHLLFEDAPEALVSKIEQVVRLVRSKGVGVYFVTQNPLDVPDTVLGQLGHRVQHALRAFTPRDQKAVKTAASTMRANPALNVETAITELAVGEALVSMLDAKGIPSVVERAWILPPASRIGPLTAAERTAVMAASPMAGRYDQLVDRESAFEQLKARTEARQPAAAAASSTSTAPAPASTSSSAPASGPASALPAGLAGVLFGSTGPRGGHHDGLLESAARSAVRTMGSSVGREIVRGVLGSIFGGRRR